MCLLKQPDSFSILGVSIAGGVSHNIGQILVAYFVTKTAGVAFYLPILLIAGIITGLLIGLAAREVLKYWNARHDWL
jgi:heptaprenyl diphosphate synthase